MPVRPVASVEMRSDSAARVCCRSAEDSRVLLDRVDAITIKYQGLNEAGETVWFEDWQEQTSLPSMVEITLTVADRPWPPIVVQIEQSSAQAAPGRRGLRSSLSWR